MRRCAAALLLLLLAAAPLAAGPIALLSKADPARPSDSAGGAGEIAGLSDDGRYVVFLSDADNLLAGVVDGNAAKDVFLYDRLAGTTVLVSHAAGASTTAGNGAALSAAVSADGRRVVFLSQATDLVAGQVDGVLTPDVFLWDRVTEATVLVSHRPGLPATAAQDGRGQLAINADGAWIAFLSNAPDLVAGQSDGASTTDVFLYDRATGLNTLVSHTAGSATTAAGGASAPGLSAAGNLLVFVSSAANLVPGQVEGNGGEDVFLYNRGTGGSVLVSHASGAAATTAGSSSFVPQISADGSRIAYQSFAANLQAGQIDVNGVVGGDVFLYDAASGTNTLVSHALGSAAQTGNAGSRDPVLSADGRFVAYLSSAGDLGPQAEDFNRDVFFYDQVTGVNTLLSQRAASSFTEVQPPRISADGAWVGFLSEDPALVAGQADDVLTWDAFLWSRVSGALSLVTHEPGSTTDTAGNSATDLRIDATGSWIALASRSPGLVAGGEDHNTLADVFLYQRAAGSHTLVTTRGGAVSASAGSSHLDQWTRAMPSNDGRRAVFTSRAPHLPVPGLADGNDATDVFLYDRVTTTMTLMSHRSGLPATAGNRASFEPVLSAVGRVAVFLSDATDLVPGQGPRLTLLPTSQLFLTALGTAETTLVSHAAGLPGTPAAGWAYKPAAVSGDGRWVAYSHLGTDLVAGQGTTVDENVYLFDRTTGTNVLVSHAGSSPVQPGNGFSHAPSISADGRYVAFRSTASDLVTGQAGGVFLYDRATGSVTSVATTGAAPLAISADGRQVVFTGGSNVYLWDRVLATTRLVSRSLASPTTPGNGPSSLGTSDNPQVLSADGRWVVFASTATDLVPGQAGGHPGIFLFDRISGTVSQVSAWAGSLTTSQPALSGDGRFVAYGSEAHDLVPGQVDSIGSPDFFRFDREAGTTSLISHVPASAVTTGKALSDATLEGPRLSADGAWSTFASLSPDLVPGDRDGTKDAFLDANLLPGRDFYTVSPCRLIDTRKGPALVSGGRSVLPAHDLCSIPATARAVAANVTVIQPSGAGYLTFHAGDSGPETTSTLTFAAGQLRSNNAIIPLAFDGTGTFAVTPLVAGNGSVHLTVDVSGWFE